MNCFVCNKECQEVSICSRCGIIFYCGKVIELKKNDLSKSFIQECQKRDWARHKPYCQASSIKLRFSKTRGISVVATKNLQPGFKVFQVFCIHHFIIIIFILKGGAHSYDKNTNNCYKCKNCSAGIL